MHSWGLPMSQSISAHQNTPVAICSACHGPLAAAVCRCAMPRICCKQRYRVASGWGDQDLTSRILPWITATGKISFREQSESAVARLVVRVLPFLSAFSQSLRVSTISCCLWFCWNPSRS